MAETEDKGSEYWKQQAQQNDANFQKARDANTALNEKLESLEETVTKLTSEKQDLLSQVDKEYTDPNLLKALEGIQTELKNTKKQLTDLETKAKVYEQTELEKAQKAQKDQIIEDILSPLDEEFGASFRAAAQKLADKWVDEDPKKQPKNPAQAAHFMRKAYLEVSKQPEPPPQTDSGDGGLTQNLNDTGELPEQGSRKEVLAAMKKMKGKWLNVQR